MRRIISVLLSAILCTGLVACSSQAVTTPQETQTQETVAATPTVLRVGMECGYAPNNWQEDAASETNLPIENMPGFFAEGYDVQMAKLIGQAVDKEIIIVKLSWDGLITALNAGQIDMIIAGMADTEVRKESINFTKTYGIGETEYMIMVKAGSPYENATTLEEFSGASILGQKDTQYDAVIDQIPGVDHLSPVPSVPNMVDRLLNDTCDGVVIDTDSAEAYTTVNSNLRLVRFAQGKGFDIDFTGACVGLRKTDDALRDEINAALATISDDVRQTLMDTALANMPQ